MKANNSLTTTGDKPEFSAYINGDKVKNGIVSRLGGDVQLASRLIATITTVVNSNDKLRECDYGSIISAALYGEIGMNLSLALGQYGIIPYGGTAKYQLQVNGLKQLCIRSKAYANIDVYDVREGEFLGRDPRTRAPIFKWIEDEDKRLELPIIGYYAFYILNDEYNNFFRCLYWSHEKILRHADRYSNAFSLQKYNDLLAGKLPPDEVAKLRGTKAKKGSSPWYAEPDADAHMKMCMKTVLKQLLNDGLAPKSIQEAIVEDDDTESGEDVSFTEAPVYVFDAEPESAQEAAETPERGVSEDKVDAREAEKTRTGGKRRGTAARSGAEDAVTSFIDGED